MEKIGFSNEELAAAMVEVVRVNRMQSCYIRPILLRGYGEMGVNPVNNPIDVYVACWEWGKYLGEEALAEGVDVCVSSWNRLAPNTLPTLAKAGANYMNSQLIKMEALANGYTEGIGLDVAGYVSEGSGENIFVVRDGKILTPPLGASVLPGITRDTVVRLAEDRGIKVVETLIPRELLYIADEVFFTGTAAEITPIRSIDRVRIGQGHRGPVAEKLQKDFFAVINGTVPDRYGWLTPVGDAPTGRSGLRKKKAATRSVGPPPPRFTEPDRAAAGNFTCCTPAGRSRATSGADFEGGFQQLFFPPLL